MIDASSVVRAGGVAPLGAQLDPDLRAGPLSARAFRHPALPGETFVRLAPDVLAAGVDVEMDTLGFERAPDADRPSLGQVRFRALGFPGWPLVHDPARAKFALEVMKSFKRAAAQARSKPGNARDEFVRIGDRLARSVPHFLPSFWEEAGRAFLAAESKSFAAQCFEKARQAEKEHNLAIDEDVRSAVYLEFALAGAVAAKSLAGYAKELADAYGPAQAWPRYRELAARRVLGGMPPWTGMAKELRALAKAAKLDVDEADASFLEELLDAPALARAPADFWTSYRDALVRLAKARPAVRKRLRHLFPRPSSGGDGFPVTWLSLLADGGALDGLSADAGEDSEPPGGAAAWLTEALGFLDGAKEILPVVKALAPRLIRDAQPVQLGIGNRWHPRIDLDVAELAFELGIPVADPAPRARIDLSRPFTADPVRLAADPRFAQLLSEAVEAVLGTAPFEEAARGKRGLQAARRAWVVGEVERLAQTALPGVAEATVRLRKKASSALWAEFPDALEALKAVDVAEALARSLRAGLFAELQWPAWESLVKTIGAAFTTSGAWPYPVLHTRSKAWVLGPEGVLFEHDLVLPPKARTEYLVWLDGDLVVTYQCPDGLRGYWASSPNDPFPLEEHLCWYGDDLPASHALPGSGTTIGGAAIRRGDRKLGTFKPFVTDGETFWSSEWHEGRFRLREFDPSTGRQGRNSWPRFVEEASSVDDGLRLLDVSLMPAPAAAARSPLGCEGGLLGRYARGPSRWEPGESTVVGIDGRRWVGSRNVPRALLRFPGDERPRAVTIESSWAGTERVPIARVLDEAGNVGCVVDPKSYGGIGWTAIPRPSLWHFLRPRDEAGSEALRAVDVRTARALLDAATEDRATEDGRKHLPKTRETIARVLPAITAAPLVDAVAAAALEASDRVARIADVIDAAAEAPVAANTTTPSVHDVIDDMALRDALGPFGNRWARGVLSDEVRAASRLLRDQEIGAFRTSQFEWLHWIGSLRGLAVLVSLAGKRPEDRVAASRLLRLFATTPFAEPGRAFRRCAVTVAADSRVHSAASNVFAVEGDESRFFFRTRRQGADTWCGTMLEHTLDGTFRLPDGVTITSEERFTTQGDASWIEAWLAASTGAPTWKAEDAEKLASATGLTRAEAVLLLAGLPNLDSYDADFLGKALRERLGLKMSDAKVARETLKALDFHKVLQVYALAAPDDPRALFAPYGEGDFVERLGRAWNQIFGARVALRDEIVVACEKELDPPLPASALLGALLDPTTAPLLRVAEVGFDATFGPSKPDVFSADAVTSLALLLPWLAHTLPVGDPYRNAIPALHEAVLAALRNPDLLLPVAHAYAEPAQKAKLRALVESIGGDEVSLKADHVPCELGRDDGALVGALFGNGHQAQFAFRPGALRDDDRRPFQLSREASTFAYRAVEAVAFLRSPGLAALVARVKSTPVPAGRYEADPSQSCPQLVDEVARALDLSREAAVHYLQLLALAEPTSKAVQTWNGWKPALYKKTCAELSAKKLVVEGKRERAGREVFLPGAWVKPASRSKNLPFEAWKKPLYAFEHGPLERNVPLRPHHELFEAAWKRVQAGDVPKFEEV